MTVPMMSVVVVVALPIDNKVLNLYFLKKKFYLLYLIYCLGYSTPIVASFAWASSSINYLDLSNGCDSNYHLVGCRARNCIGPIKIIGLENLTGPTGQRAQQH